MTGCSACASVPTYQPPRTSEWPGSEVAVVLQGADGEASGCPIGPDTMLTAAHVVEHAPLIWKARGQEGPTLPVYIDKELDLATLQTDKPLPSWVPLAAHAPFIGEEVAILGELTDMRTVFIARVVGVRKDNGWLVLDGMIAPGTSGGCVLSRDGKVYAIALGAVYWNEFPSVRSVAYARPVWEGE